jgi:hypothetical protein
LPSVVNVPAMPDEPGPEYKSPGQPVGHSADNDAAASIQMRINNIISLSHRLNAQAPRDSRIDE